MTLVGRYMADVEVVVGCMVVVVVVVVWFLERVLHKKNISNEKIKICIKL